MLLFLNGIALAAQIILASYTWTETYDCDDLGRPLTSEEFIDLAITQVALGDLRVWTGDGSSGGRKVVRPKSVSEFKGKFPNCCSFYTGPPADYFAPQGFIERFMRPIAKVVKLQYREPSYISSGHPDRVVERYEVLDACGIVFTNDR